MLVVYCLNGVQIAFVTYGLPELIAEWLWRCSRRGNEILC